MTSARIVAAFAALVVGFGVTGDAQQADEPVRSARLVLSRKTLPTVVVHLRNLRDVPIVTWSVSAGQTFTWATTHPNDDPAHGPINPNEERDIVLDDPRGYEATVRPVVIVAVYADGTVEGTSDGIARELAGRASAQVEAEYWRTELATMPRESNEALARFIEARRRNAPKVDDHFMPVAAKLQMLAASVGQREPGGLVQAVDRERTAIAALATRRALSPRDRSSTHVWSEPGTKAQIVASIDNRSSFPIREFRVALRNASGHVNRRMGSTFETSPPGARVARGIGAIGPGEVREVGVILDRDAPAAEWPTAFLEFVVFADGRVEGSRAAYEESRRRR